MPLGFGELVLGALLSGGLSSLAEAAREEIAALRTDRRRRHAFQSALDRGHADFAKKYPEAAHSLLDATYVQRVAPEFLKLLRRRGEPDLDRLVEEYAVYFGGQAPAGSREALAFLVDRARHQVDCEPLFREELNSRAIETIRETVADATPRTAAAVEDIARSTHEIAEALRTTTPPSPLHAGEGVPPAAPVDQEGVLRAYLKALLDEHGRLRLVEQLSPQRARQMTHRAEQPPELEKVYVPLSATLPAKPPNRRRGKRTRGGRSTEDPLPEGAERRVTIEKLLRTHRALTVTGGPGSGKTTLMGHLAVCYARSLLPGDRADPVRKVLRLPRDTGLLPVLLPLRPYGAFLASKREPEAGGADLVAFAARYYTTGKRKVPGISQEFFKTHLNTGCVFLLDGMDEVSPEVREGVRQEILALRRTLEGDGDSLAPHRIIVTARPAAVAGEWALDRFHQATILEFNPDDQRRFVAALFADMDGSGGNRRGRRRSASANLAESFLHLVHRGPHAAHLSQLAGIPLLLTIMAVLYHERQFPPELPGLLEEATERILRKWNLDDQGMMQHPLPLTEAVRLDRDQVRDLHRPLGVFFLDRHEESVTREAFVAEVSRLIRLLGFHERDAREAAKALVHQYIEERAGLIVWRGPDDFGFLHNDFRDYLAATDFQKRVQRGLNADSLIGEVVPRLSLDHWTHLAIPMLVRLLDDSGGSQRETASQLVATILAHPDSAGRRGQNLLLGGRAFLGAQLAKAESDRRLAIRDRLLAALTDLTIPARMRARLGSLLAEYGDPRPEVTGLPPMWVEVPAGACWIGSTAEGAYPDERPQAYVQFPAFRIMQYPVTQAQYAEFVQAKGYAPPTAEYFPEYSWRNRRSPRGRENHPVILVSFTDAVVFCEWLSGELGFEVRLPTEGEWEYAAKAPQPEEERERTYPWGGLFDPEKCNTSESGIHGTSPVGMFPHGRRPGGPHEMAGNVWEWTASVYKTYPYRREDDEGWETRHTRTEAIRTIRGGSWGGPRAFARCAGRGGARPPGSRSVDLGFRCCSRSPEAVEF